MLTTIKGEFDSNTIIVGDFNTPRSPMDRSSKMKINKETQALNETLKKMDWDFPGGPVVKTLPSNAGGMGPIPGWGTKIPHAVGCGQKLKKKKKKKEKDGLN